MRAALRRAVETGRLVSYEAAWDIADRRKAYVIRSEDFARMGEEVRLEEDGVRPRDMDAVFDMIGRRGKKGA